MSSTQSDFTFDYTQNLQMIYDEIGPTSDLRTRFIEHEKFQAAIVFLETLVAEEKIEQTVLLPITIHSSQSFVESIITANLKSTVSFRKCIDAMIEGYAIITINNDEHVYLVGASKGNNRAITEPDNEKVLRGSHQGFIEDIHTNLQLIRQGIQDKNLMINYYTIGKKTKSKISMVYMKDIAQEDLVEEVKTRIDSIDVDMMFSPGYMSEFIEDTQWSPFPQILISERPDRAIAHLMEGRVVIFGGGSPSALIMPANFFSFYQSPDDYNSRFLTGSFYRIIRLISFVIAITLPAIYIATVSFHFEVIPESLLLPVKGSLENLPYPPLVEALLMELTIELIREAGIRLPSSISATIGIVGGLVIGDAVVAAGVVSTTMLIIVSLTAVSSYVVPSPEMNTAIRILRFPLMIAATVLGYLGIVFGLMILLIHLCKLETFNSPYFSPVAPFHWKELKDTFIRAPIWKLNKRPSDAQPKQQTKEENSRKWKQDE